MSILVQYADVFIILACVFGFFMAWGVGANDVANAMGTSVGSKAITIKQAIVIAILFGWPTWVVLLGCLMCVWTYR